MAGAELPILPDILEEHLGEFEFLWDQRRDALRSPRYTPRELVELEDRIEAHVQGLLAGGEQTAALVRPGLGGDELWPAFAAAYVLSRLGGRAAVWDAFARAQGGRLAGIRQALCYLPIEDVRTPLRQIVAGSTAAPAEVRAAAAEVLGFHGRPAL